MSVPDLRCRAGTAWVVDEDAVRLLDALTGRTRRLTYPEAAIWALWQVGHPWERVASLLATIEGVSEGQARLLMKRAVAEWEADGFVERS